MPVDEIGPSTLLVPAFLGLPPFAIFALNVLDPLLAQGALLVSSRLVRILAEDEPIVAMRTGALWRGHDERI
jgi:hypothetical protein